MKTWTEPIPTLTYEVDRQLYDEVMAMSQPEVTLLMIRAFTDVMRRRMRPTFMTAQADILRQLWLGRRHQRRLRGIP
jgi:DNA-binding FadR family transcriptional regulator